MYNICLFYFDTTSIDPAEYKSTVDKITAKLKDNLTDSTHKSLANMKNRIVKCLDGDIDVKNANKPFNIEKYEDENILKFTISKKRNIKEDNPKFNIAVIYYQNDDKSVSVKSTYVFDTQEFTNNDIEIDLVSYFNQ